MASLLPPSEVAYTVETRRCDVVHIARASLPTDMQLVMTVEAPAIPWLRPEWVQTEPESLAGVELPAGVRALPVFHDDPALQERVLAYRGGAARPALVEGPGRGGRGDPNHSSPSKVPRPFPPASAPGILCFICMFMSCYSCLLCCCVVCVHLMC